MPLQFLGGLLSTGVGTAVGVAKAVAGNPIGAIKWASKKPLVGAAIKAGWDRRQTNTGYQRAMHDMRKAGLNPLLAGKYGPAASATMEGLGSVINTANQVETQKQQLEINKEQLQLNKIKTTADIEKIDQEIKESMKRVGLIDSQISEITANIILKLAQTDKTNAEAQAIKITNETLENSPLLEDVKTLGSGKLIMSTLGGIAGLALIALQLLPAGRVPKLVNKARKTITTLSPKLNKYFKSTDTRKGTFRKRRKGSGFQK
jgi:hypothetical protein